MFFFFNDAAPTEIYTLSLHDALPIFARLHAFAGALHGHGVSLLLVPVFARPTKDRRWERARAEVYTDAIGSSVVVANSLVVDRKSTRLNSSHANISYAVFCLKKKNNK